MERHFFRLRTNVDDVIRTKYKEGEPAVFDLQLKNFAENAVLWRVKVTDNSLFQLSPPAGILARDAEVTVRITFPGRIDDPKKLHHVVVFHVDATESKFNGKEHEDPDELWDGEKKDKENFYEKYCAARYFLVDLMKEGEKKPVWGDLLDTVKQIEQRQADIERELPEESIDIDCYVPAIRLQRIREKQRERAKWAKP